MRNEEFFRGRIWAHFCRLPAAKTGLSAAIPLPAAGGLAGFPLQSLARPKGYPLQSPRLKTRRRDFAPQNRGLYHFRLPPSRLQPEVRLSGIRQNQCAWAVLFAYFFTYWHRVFPRIFFSQPSINQSVINQPQFGERAFLKHREKEYPKAPGNPAEGAQEKSFWFPRPAASGKAGAREA
jgi:hypothetical protein